jgi:hypothetical protein
MQRSFIASSLPSALALAAALLAQPAVAANPGPFSTGVDASGARLAQNSVDPHYQIVGSSVFGPAAYAKLSGAPIDNGAWINNSSASSWLVPAVDFFFTDQPGVTDTITYRTQFDLSSFSAPGWRIDGRWAADDSGLTIRLNGTAVPGVGVAQADQWTSFSISDGILSGLNTLEFTTRSTVSPTGLRVELTTTAVPEPSAWLLMAAGFGLLALRRRGTAQ